MDWEEAPLPIFYKNLKPPIAPFCSYMQEAEEATHNMNSAPIEGTYSGHQIIADNQKEEYFVTFNINVEKEGKYLILCASGPVGAMHISPTDLYIDDQFIKEFTDTPKGDYNWGWCSCVTWVSYGAVTLSPGSHTFTFKVHKPRDLDGCIIQNFDALCLLDSDELNISIKAKANSQSASVKRVADAQLSPSHEAESSNLTIPTFKRKDVLNISLRPILKSCNINQASIIAVPIKLMKYGRVVKEYTATFKLDPKSIGEPLPIDFTCEIPYDISNGEYYFESDNITTETGEHLLNINLQGEYPTPPQKSLVAKDLTLKNITFSKKNNSISFNVSANLLAPCSSDILTILFEHKKDVVYYAKSVYIPNLKGQKGEFLSEPITITLPQDMPKGKVKALLSLNKDISSSSPVEINIDTSFTEKTTSLKPISYGFYKDNTGMTQVWYANEAHTLFWNGEPFFNISGMLGGRYISFTDTEYEYEYFKNNIQILKKYGINHVYIFTNGGTSMKEPYKWENMMDYLESEGFTYVMGYCNGTGKYDRLRLREIYANPEKSKIIKNVIGKVTHTVKYSEYQMSSAPVEDIRCASLTSQGEITKVKEAKIIDKDQTGVTFEIDFGNSEPIDILIDMSFSCYQPISNPWKNYKDQYTQVQKDLIVSNLRPGFRGFIDMILPNERAIVNEFEPGFIETEEFINHRAELLKEKYKNIDTLKKAWKVMGDFVKTFEEAASLYPLYNNGKIIFLTSSAPSLQKEKGEQPIFKIDATSIFWYEYLDLRDKNYGYFQNIMLDKVKEACDAPIALKLTGLPEIFNVPDKPNRLGLDAVGCETYSTGEGHITYDVGFRYNEMLAAKKAMIGSSTEMARGWSEDMYPNWSDIQALFFDLGVTHYLGNKITYLFLLDTLPDTMYNKNRILRDTRILEWMALWKEILEDKKEVVSNYTPIVYSSWPRPDATWTLVSERRAIKETDDAYGVNGFKCPNGVWCLPTTDPFAPNPMTFVTLNDSPATEFFKEDFENLIKMKNKEIVISGHRKNIGALSVDKYYTEEYISDESYTYQVLNPPANAEILHEYEGKVWAFKLDNLQFIAAQPKGNFNALESILKFAKYTEVNAEKRDAIGYLEKVLGLSFVNFGGGAFKAVGYTLKGEDVSVLHTTNEKGGDKITFRATKDCIFTCPYLNISENLSKGDSYVITLPEKDSENISLGAGLGYIKIIGESLEDLVFDNMTMDGPLQATSAGYDVTGLAKGLLLPTPKRPEVIKNNTTEVVRSRAAFDSAIEAYNIGLYGACQEKLEEHLPLAGEELSPAFNIFLGNILLLRGNIEKSIYYYETALQRDPENKDAKCGLGCAVYNKDKEKAIKLWEEAGTEEAVNNINAVK